MRRGFVGFSTVWAMMSFAPALAVAGPAFTEPPSDAGSRKSSAADASGGVGQPGTISGMLSGTSAARGLPDFEDMYIINITEPGTWLATTSPAHGRGLGFADFDSVLWLFDFNDERGLLANDNADASLPGARLLNMSTDGTGVSISVPGLYLLAISVKGRMPLDPGGNPIFQLLTPTEVSGPDGSTLPLETWAGTPLSPLPGSYRIDIVPAPGAAAVILLGLARSARRRRSPV